MSQIGFRTEVKQEHGHQSNLALSSALLSSTSRLSPNKENAHCLVCYNILEEEVLGLSVDDNDQNRGHCSKEKFPRGDDIQENFDGSRDISPSPRDLTPDDYQGLLKIFCDYLELEQTHFAQKSGTKKSEIFPFCKMCEVMLFDLCALHEEMERLVTRARRIKAALIKVILESSTESSNIQFVEDGSNEEKCDENIDTIREIIASRYSAKVLINPNSKVKSFQAEHEHFYKHGEQKADVNYANEWGDNFNVQDHVQDQDYDQMNANALNCFSANSAEGCKLIGINDSELTNTGSTQTRTFTTTKSGRIVKHYEKYKDEVGRISKKVKEEQRTSKTGSAKQNRSYEEIGRDKFIYAGKFLFEKVDNKYKCGTCYITKVALPKIIRHIRTTHHKLRPSTRRNLKLIEVKPNRFLYGNKYGAMKVNNKFRCCTCGSETADRASCVKHLREKHYLNDKEEQQRVEEGIVKAPLDLNSMVYPIVQLNEYILPDSDDDGQDEVEGGVHENSTSKSDKSDNNYNCDANTNDGQYERDDSNSESDVGEGDAELEESAKGSKSYCEVSPDQFLYRDAFPFTKEGNQYVCGTAPCTVISATLKKILLHVRRCHYEKKNRIRFIHRLVQTSENKYMYAKKFPVEVVDGVYICVHCNHSSRGKYSLVEHIRIKHLNPVQEFMCETCGKSFSTPRNFCKHKRMHKSVSNFACEICGRSFEQQAYLTRHLKTHMGDDSKNFVCEYCGKKFRTKMKLIGHTSVHTGEKTFQCTVCPMLFGTYNSMSYHRVNVHGKVGTQFQNL